MLGGDQMPSEWRKEGGGWMVRSDLRRMRMVVSVMPMFFWAPPLIGKRKEKLAFTNAGLHFRLQMRREYVGFDQKRHLQK